MVRPVRSGLVQSGPVQSDLSSSSLLFTLLVLSSVWTVPNCNYWRFTHTSYMTINVHSFIQFAVRPNDQWTTVLQQTQRIPIHLAKTAAWLPSQQSIGISFSFSGRMTLTTLKMSSYFLLSSLLLPSYYPCVFITPFTNITAHLEWTFIRNCFGVAGRLIEVGANCYTIQIIPHGVINKLVNSLLFWSILNNNWSLQ